MGHFDSTLAHHHFHQTPPPALSRVGVGVNKTRHELQPEKKRGLVHHSIEKVESLCTFVILV